MVLAVASVGISAATEEAAAAKSAEESPAWVKRATEVVLSRLLEVDVVVGDVAFDKEANVLKVKDLKVDNPDGFNAEHCASVQELEVEAPLKQLFSPEPVVERIHVRGAVVTAETGLKGMNFQRLLETLQGRGGKMQEFAQRREKLWRIKQVDFEDAQLKIRSPFIANKDASLDALDMSFEGDDGKGLPARQALQQLFQRLMKEAEVSDATPEAGGEKVFGNLLEGLLGN